MSNSINTFNAIKNIYISYNNQTIKREREIKRRRKLTYFNGNGQKKWEIQNPLIIEDVNISSSLARFRRKSISAAEKKRDLTPIRILGLSFIFPVNKFDSVNCISSYLEEEAAVALVREAYKGIQLPKVSGLAVLYCKQLIDEEDIQPSFAATSDLDDAVVELAKSFFTGSAIANDRSEASFTMKFLWPVLQMMLLDGADEDTVFSVFDVAEEGRSCKPDFQLGLKNRKREVYFFFVEVKRPDKQSKYQEEDDFVKLLKQLKTSLDRQLLLGMKNPISFGLLCEGFHCSLYRMSLKAEGIYMPVMIKRFSLVSNSSELMNTPLIVEAIGAVKNEFASFKAKYQERTKEEVEKISNLMKPSFVTKFKK
ncbi:hypothetical protein CU098_012877 [Rhizopus stolonifer]|uniref:Uncharacterized protein n=1 Tax=Rhizopus stolonifer TaxID=4846 RepID=A0A367KWY9_RHIST|nr:hypothetical protein CU098_012877 [Rhizopus stolonifer]